MPFQQAVRKIEAVSVGETAPAALFPSKAYRIAVDDALTRMLSASGQRLQQGSVAPTTHRAAAEAALASVDFGISRELPEVLDWVTRQMEAGMVQISHPRYFGLFNPAPTFASQCADRITSFFNPQLASATTSPFPVALERHVIRQLAQRLRMPRETSGHFTSGGSEANAAAVICALTRAEASYAHAGVYAFTGQPLVYVSQDAHLAWLKIGHQAGIGRNSIRLIATDGTGRMDSIALATALKADRAAGHLPALIVSTAGTTGAGMIDNLRVNAEIARTCGVWHHVDAAWGGALAVSDRLRGLLGGIELADSITIDAHKWLATTMGCGMFMTAHPAVLSDAFHVVMDCMPSNVADLDPYVTTAQWSRRFVGLRLFVGLATAGWDGYGAHVEHAVQLTDVLRAGLIRCGWQLVNRSPLAVSLFRPPVGSPDVRQIAAAIVQSGKAWLSTVDFEGEKLLRICITSGETTDADVTDLIALLEVQSNQR